MDQHGFGDIAGLERRLRTHVETLAATPRPPGTAAHRNARDYIRTHLGAAGFQVDAVAYPSVFEAPGVNLLTAPAPADDALPLLIIGAHYDFSPTLPGADDNASAVAALLELAAWAGLRLAQGGRTTARLVLAAYDEEEFGLLGSGHHSGQIGSPP